MSGILDEAKRRFIEDHNNRVKDMASPSPDPFFRVPRRLAVRPENPRSPAAAEIAVSGEWLTAGAVCDIEGDDTARLFYLPDADDEGRLSTYLVMPCPRCDQPTPVLPELEEDRAWQSLGEAAVAAQPVDAHLCR